MSAGEIHSDGCDEQPRCLVGPEQRQRKNGNPGNRLSDDAPENLRGSAREPMGDFDGNQLSPCAQKLWNGGEEAQLEWCRVKQQGKGREILLTSALGDGLEQPITNAKASTGLVGIYGSGMVAGNLFC